MSTVITDELPEEIPLLDESGVQDLPEGAVRNEDGSIVLPLLYKKVLRFRTPGGAAATETPIEFLTFRPLTGIDYRAMMKAKDPTMTAMARATGMSDARAALVIDILDAADFRRAGAVVLALTGGDWTGDLPPNATDLGEKGVRLDLTQPASDGSAPWTSLEFSRLTVKEQRQAVGAPDLCDWFIARATKLDAEDAHRLYDDLSGADARGVQAVLGFLLGSGR